jgi:hypothetical protein
MTVWLSINFELFEVEADFACDCICRLLNLKSQLSEVLHICIGRVQG